MGSDVEALEGRLARLERENRHLRLLGVLVLVGVAAAFTYQSKMARNRHEVAAERFVIRDRTGKVQAEMGLRTDGTPHVSLYDSEGRELVSMSGTIDDSALLTFSDRGRDRISIRSSAGGAGLSFVDRKHGNTSGFYLTDDGKQGFGLRGSKGQLHLNIDRDGTAGLSFLDRDGKPVSGLGLAADGSPEWTLAGRAGRSILELPGRGVTSQLPPVGPLSCFEESPSPSGGGSLSTLAACAP